jgi:CAAX protease family protein
MASLRSAVERLSPPAEFTLVCLLAFGWFSLGSIIAVLTMNVAGGAGSAASAPHIEQHHLRVLLVYESIVILGLGWGLVVRGWSRSQIGLKFSWGATAIGMVMAAGAYFVASVAAAALMAESPDLGNVVYHTRIVSGGIGAGTILAASVVNPVFEEVFVCGYVVTFLKSRHGLWFAVNVSAAIRLLYHLYQGPVAVVTVLPVALGFAYWYARTNQLWPLISAHAVMDAVGLIANQ